MKALAILGTASNVGKSWMVTALGALLHRQGVRVAPFKAQNMSNNSYVTLEGGEIGRAQAVQAEACGLRPHPHHNPILLKPSGQSTSQLILLGKPGPHIPARDYYHHVDHLWQVVRSVLEDWRDHCDVLLLEGAGSPVELNLMDRDIVNLRPLHHLQGQWLLVGDIEKGGVFAQIIGTYQLLPPAMQTAGLGFVVNKFRGDPSLFATAQEHFHNHLPTLPYLGVLPYQEALQPENEDSLCQGGEKPGTGAVLAWIRFPYLSNSQDSQPWQLDTGVQVRWVRSPAELDQARIIILPGTKNTLHDLRWLRTTGLAAAIQAAAARGIPVVGICGGYQMLGTVLHDPDGLAGEAGTLPGLHLLPAITHFEGTKQVHQVTAHWGTSTWQAYEIHMGRTQPTAPIPALLQITRALPGPTPEGMVQDSIWGTYLHGLFESAPLRQALVDLAHIQGYRPSPLPWTAHRQALYQGMADLLENHLDLGPLYRYLEK